MNLLVSRRISPLCGWDKGVGRGTEANMTNKRRERGSYVEILIVQDYYVIGLG
jgi:hypothetical protein